MRARELHDEPIIEPELPIVDPHHHLWVLSESELQAFDGHAGRENRAISRMFRMNHRYLIEEVMADVGCGHNVRATVAVEAHRMYRKTGPAASRSVGEVEFINGVAAMSASGLFGEVRLCAGIVGGLDLSIGEGVGKVLEAHMRAGGDRYRGVRPVGLAYDEGLTEQRHLLGRPHLLLDPDFRVGFGHLEPLGLSCDIMIMDSQLPELIDLARAFPGTRIVLDHVGSPIGFGPYAGRLQERFPAWRNNIRSLSKCPSVVVKLGGLGMPNCGFPSTALEPRAPSQELARDWRPYIETCIEAFGVDRCMFESNFPIEAITASYRTLWNAFKLIVRGASAGEKTALFSRTAACVYGLEY